MRSSASRFLEQGPAEGWGDRAAAWLLSGPLTVFVLALCGVQLATWLPHYLTWPWYADHDVFAVLALGWEHGQLPYRDLAGDNFPGTIYLFWVLGKVFGWGRTVPWYALDAAFVVVLGSVLLLWSGQRFGRRLPGALGFAVFLSYYLSEDFGGVAQRDWHGPFFVVCGLLLAEAYPAPWSRGLAALTAAFGFAVRPQVILFLPALLLVVVQGIRAAVEPRSEPARESESTRAQAIRAAAGWAMLLLGFTFLGFLPLVLAGTFDDFVRSMRLVHFGSPYNQARFWSVLRLMLLQLLQLKRDVVPLLVLVLSTARDSDRLRTTRLWLLAYLGAWLYKPISPVPYAYLDHPLTLLWSINIAVLVGLILSMPPAQPSLKLAAVLLAALLGVEARPEMCSLRYTRDGLQALLRGEDPRRTPLGMHIGLPAYPRVVAFPWHEYRETLAYLRTQVGPETKVANLLHVVPALNGPSGRLTPLPAESLAWLSVRPDDERLFAAALHRAPAGTLVVWTPVKGRFVDLWSHYPQVERLAPIIRRDYRAVARFGDIEVGRRAGDHGERE